jgi:hypothetical protein
VVTVAKRTHGGTERLGAPELAPQDTQACAIELESFDEPGQLGRLQREDAPPGAVEVDGDAAGPGGAECGDSFSWLRQEKLGPRHLGVSGSRHAVVGWWFLCR